MKTLFLTPCKKKEGFILLKVVYLNCKQETLATIAASDGSITGSLHVITEVDPYWSLPGRL